MKNFNRFLLAATLLSLAPHISAAVGLGPLAVQDIGSADGYFGTVYDRGLHAELSRESFRNPWGLGAYFYMNIRSLFDLEAEIVTVRSCYSYDFSSYYQIRPISSTGKNAELPYSRGSVYLTIRRKLASCSVPLFEQLHIEGGAGISYHRRSPYLKIETLQDILGEDIYSHFESAEIEELISDHLNDRRVDKPGVHIQGGVSFRLAGGEAFLFYRHTLARNIFVGKPGFGCLVFRLGLLL